MGRQNGTRIFNIIDTKDDNKVVFNGNPNEAAEKLGVDFRYIYNLASSGKLVFRRYKIEQTNEISEAKVTNFKVIDTLDSDKVVFVGSSKELVQKYGIAVSYVYRLCNEGLLLKKRYKIVKE